MTNGSNGWLAAKADLVIVGHTHVPLDRTVGRTLIDVATALRGSRPSRCAWHGTIFITASFVLT